MIIDLIWAIACIMINLFWYREYQKMNLEWYEDCLKIIELLSGQAERTELADELVKEADHGTD